MTRPKRLALLSAAMTVGAASLTFGGGHRAAQAGPGQLPEQNQKLAQAAALAEAPAPERGPLSSSYAADQAREPAATRAAAIPLPEGGNFNGIRWELAGGTVSDAELQSVLQYNAACQWLRAWHDGREAAVASRVFGHIARWPTLRNTAAGYTLHTAAEERSPHAAVSRGLLADCRASHEREVQYAQSLGLPAPQ